MQEHEVRDESKVSLIVPKFRNEAFADILVPKSKPRNFTIHLDDLGSAAWLAIDGEMNVQQICDIVYHKYKDTFQSMDDAIERITKYFSMLYEERYINFKELER